MQVEKQRKQEEKKDQSEKSQDGEEGRFRDNKERETVLFGARKLFHSSFVIFILLLFYYINI